jgi:uncharacterized membrane protein
MPAPRRGYLDWVRGLAVLIMIEAHLFDSWTWAPDRETPLFTRAIILGGLGAPLFLFLAGVSVPLAASARLRRTASAAGSPERALASRRAAGAVAKRGLEIFGLAFLFRLQAWVLGWSSPRALLKVDILNIMGPSISAAALLWGTMTSWSGRLLAFIAATLALAFATPIIRALPIGALPDPIEAYIRPVPYLSNFVFFPWMAFVFAGAIPGLLIDRTVDPAVERKLNLGFLAGGTALALGAWAASYGPTPYTRSDFWTTSPSYFLMRAGILTAAIGVAYLWDSRPGAEQTWSPMRELGRSSLFIYWIHIEMIYGLISRPLHRALPLSRVFVAYVLFVCLMVGASMLKNRVMAWWRVRKSSPAPA